MKFAERDAFQLKNYYSELNNVFAYLDAFWRPQNRRSKSLLIN